ncbi:hypothetical protein HMPREF9056_01774 [Actinomyces sp. oral taxon 170 str. F0386]|nr:hypothetical protein HMPREF9056_01774 [Actinomyces sp. oral taxon 170 str. F0386]
MRYSRLRAGVSRLPAVRPRQDSGSPRSRGDHPGSPGPADVVNRPQTRQARPAAHHP